MADINKANAVYMHVEKANYDDAFNYSSIMIMFAVMISDLHKCNHVLQYMLNQIIHYIDIIFSM